MLLVMMATTRFFSNATRDDGNHKLLLQGPLLVAVWRSALLPEPMARLYMSAKAGKRFDAETGYSIIHS